MHLSVFTYQEKYCFALVSFEKHLSYSQVADDLYNIYRHEIGQVEALIVRPPVEKPFNDPIQEIKEAKMLLERFPYLSIFLLYSNDFRIEISDNLQESSDVKSIPYPKTEFLSFCQQKEMEEFVLHSQAIYRSPAQSVFRTPSQEYTTAFLRVGNIQNRRHVLDVIFFWLLPRLKGAGALLTDSWSISSISLNIGRLYARYQQHLSRSVQGDHFHVNFLTTFYHGKREMNRETRQALAPLLYANDKKILFLVSAIKTQKSLDSLRQELKQQGFWDKIDIICLYALQQVPGVPGLCILGEQEFLRKANLANGFESIPEPPDGHSVVVVDERTFIPATPQVKELELKKALAPSSAAFFDRYLGTDAITVHRNAYFANNTIQRHHAFFIDITVLLKHQHFRQSLERKIEDLPSLPSMLIYPPHAQGEMFVQVIQELLERKFGQTIPLYCFADLDTLAELAQAPIRTKIGALQQDDLILVVDDVMTTGNRLKRYQKNLREAFYAGRIYYLVGVARPPRNEDMRFLKRDLVFRPNSLPFHTFEFIEQVFLPDWDSVSCPWCKERKLLSRLADEKLFEGTKLDRIFKRRQNLLDSKVANGIIHEVFHSLNGAAKATFTGGSIFSEQSAISEAELVTRVAAAIHHFKTEGIKVNENHFKLGVDFPLYTIVRSDDYLSNTFNDALVQSAILRSCSAQELYAVEDSHLQRQKKLLHAIITDVQLKPSEKCFFLYEVFLALQAYKLPTPAMNKDWKTIFEELLVVSPEMPDGE